MKIHRPLWAEGTFLSSQQFQQQARWEAFSNDSIAQLCIRHPWGITVFPPLFSLLSELLEASLPSRVIALDLESLPGNRWKADLHDPRLREEADFYLSVRSSLPAHQVLHQLPLVCKIGAPDDVTLLINVALNGVPLVPLTSVPAALPLRLKNQYFALDMHSDAAKSMLESGCCMIYAPGTMGDLKPELFAVLRT
ncbi:type VI secretion system baseplate subunit TssK [Escherichia coli]|nr:type VI secretion system baseplate subunit TssK [Escherichia coli]